jgi:hypothetical protein
LLLEFEPAHPQLINDRLAYVSVSRASHEALLFTDDLAGLTRQLNHQVSKSSALELDETFRRAQVFGL